MGHATLSKTAEIDRNLGKFLEMLPRLMPAHAGQYVLMRHGEIVEFYESAIDAQIAGNRKFDDGVFSIQQVKEMAEELGYFSYAVSPKKS